MMQISVRIFVLLCWFGTLPADAATSGAVRLAEEKKAVMDNATEKLRQSKLTAQALKKGDKIPMFSLPNAKGQQVAIEKLLAEGPVVLTFYRGGWCPYCNLQLRAYQEILPDLKALGAQLVAVSPETPDNSLNTEAKNELKFQVLSDSGNKVGKKLGLVFGLPDDLKALYKEMGIDLEKSQANPDWELPVPATYVVTQGGRIAYSFVNVDYKKRAEPSEILQALRELKSKPK